MRALVIVIPLCLAALLFTLWFTKNMFKTRMSLDKQRFYKHYREVQAINPEEEEIIETYIYRPHLGKSLKLEPVRKIKPDSGKIKIVHGKWEPERGGQNEQLFLDDGTIFLDPKEMNMELVFKGLRLTLLVKSDYDDRILISLECHIGERNHFHDEKKLARLVKFFEENKFQVKHPI